MLCRVQSSVCAGHEIAEIGRDGSAEARDSEARCGTESTANNGERLGFKLFADALDGNGDIFFFHVGDDYEKLFSSQTGVTTVSSTESNTAVTTFG
jgi:hypothetical protein